MNEIVIGICDDEIVAAEQIKQIVFAYMKKVKREARILVFHSGEELLEYVEEIQILFLDIEMPQMDGIEVGKIICKRNRDCKIIMATSRMERFKEAFKIEAFRFVTKPFSVGEIEEALQDAIDTKIGMDEIELYENRVLHKVEQRNIKYVKAYGSFIEAKVGNRVLRKELSMLKMEELLDKNIFYRINREILVNMFYIDSYKDGIINIDAQTFIVSRRRKKEFEKVFMEFDLKYRG